MTITDSDLSYKGTLDFISSYSEVVQRIVGFSFNSTLLYCTLQVQQKYSGRYQ